MLVFISLPIVAHRTLTRTLSSTNGTPCYHIVERGIGTISNCAYLKKNTCTYVSFAIRVNPLSPSIPLDRSRRVRNVATRTKEPRSRCPAAILIHKSQGAPWSRSGTSERQTSRLIEPRRVLTRGGSVLKPLSSVKDHRKPVRLPSRSLGQLRARSRYPSSSRKPVCPRHRRRYIHLCFSLYTIELLLASSSRFLNHARRVEITMI